MSKMITRSMIIAFLLCIIIISSSVDMILLAMFGCFWLGFVISAIVAKEKDNLIFWAASRGVPTSLINQEENHERNKRKGDGKAKQKA